MLKFVKGICHDFPFDYIQMPHRNVTIPLGISGEVRSPGRKPCPSFDSNPRLSAS